MSLSREKRAELYALLMSEVLAKLKKYRRETAHMPFHTRQWGIQKSQEKPTRMDSGVRSSSTWRENQDSTLGGEIDQAINEAARAAAGITLA